MKVVNELYSDIEKRKDFVIIERSFNGGAGRFTKGSLRGASVVWSFAGGWEHVSINLKNRTPDWDEMCLLKDIFWRKDEAVIQIHPAEANYVNNAQHCLHL